MNVIPYANSLFEQPWWLDTVAPGQWEEALVTDDHGAVVARMPYVKAGNRIVMPPQTQNLGIWMAPEIRKDYAAQKNAINEIFGRFAGCKSVLHTLSPANSYILPFRWLGYRMEPRFTYRLTDLSDCEKLHGSFAKNCKRHIKSAQKKLLLRDQTDVDMLWRMLDKTFEAQKRKNPMSKDLVYRIVETCEKLGHGKYMEARDEEGNVHSCAYYVYDEEVCYYLFGASDADFRSSGAQSLILWEGIKFASEHSKVFDFEGSMIEGIENFFRQFGGVCTPYYEVRKMTLLEEILEVLKPRIKRILGYKM
ncbi:MAG: GNAT family N-acetyltransferase [Oscillospiraceae bacterium]|nr:GNAT family N-acetyltransferase [Oscillospiraceae bacterium]